MDSPQKRLTTIREELFGPRGRTAMAELLGIRLTTYVRYEESRQLPADLMAKLFQAKRVNPHWLRWGFGEKFLPGDDKTAPAESVEAVIAELQGENAELREHLLKDEAPLTVREGLERSIPIVATASAATYSRTAYTDHGDLGSERLPADIHLVKVVGESMIPVAYPGQYVLCTREQPDHGGLALVAVEDDDELKFKRVYYRGDKVELVSIFNPNPKVEPPMLARRSVKLYKVWGVKF